MPKSWDPLLRGAGSTDDRDRHRPALPTAPRPTRSNSRRSSGKTIVDRARAYDLTSLRWASQVRETYADPPCVDGTGCAWLHGEHAGLFRPVTSDQARTAPPGFVRALAAGARLSRAVRVAPHQHTQELRALKAIRGGPASSLNAGFWRVCRPDRLSQSAAPAPPVPEGAADEHQRPVPRRSAEAGGLGTSPAEHRRKAAGRDRDHFRSPLSAAWMPLAGGAMADAHFGSSRPASCCVGVAQDVRDRLPETRRSRPSRSLRLPRSAGMGQDRLRPRLSMLSNGVSARVRSIDECCGPGRNATSQSSMAWPSTPSYRIELMSGTALAARTARGADGAFEHGGARAEPRRFARSGPGAVPEPRSIFELLRAVARPREEGGRALGPLRRALHHQRRGRVGDALLLRRGFLTCFTAAAKVLTGKLSGLRRRRPPPLNIINYAGSFLSSLGARLHARDEAARTSMTAASVVVVARVGGARAGSGVRCFARSHRCRSPSSASSRRSHALSQLAAALGTRASVIPSQLVARNLPGASSLAARFLGSREGVWSLDSRWGIQRRRMLRHAAFTGVLLWALEHRGGGLVRELDHRNRRLPGGDRPELPTKRAPRPGAPRSGGGSAERLTAPLRRGQHQPRLPPRLHACPRRIFGLPIDVRPRHFLQPGSLVFARKSALGWRAL